MKVKNEAKVKGLKFWHKNLKITKNWYICINLFVMGKNTSIVLGNHFESFINSVIASGSYSSTSEVIRAGLRILEENEMEKQLLLKELQKGARFRAYMVK